MKSVLFLLILISSQSFAAAGNVGKVVGSIGLVEGDVLVDSKPVKKNAPVREGSVVEVKKGHATVILGKGSVFNIAEDSKMVVTQYAMKTDSSGETGELDLKFGRTRALILNQGNEKKDIRIKARAATMGVRGTEIYVDAPRDQTKPIQFFTLEGKAEVRAYPGAVPVPVPQNQGVSASGIAPVASKGTAGSSSSNSNSNSGNSKSGVAGNTSVPTTGGTNAPAQTAVAVSAPNGSGNSEVAPATITVADVKTDIAKSGMDPAPATGGLPPSAAGAAPSRAAPVGLAGGTTIAPIPPPPLDPVLDRASPLSIRPHFCNANTGVCN